MKNTEIVIDNKIIVKSEIFILNLLKMDGLSRDSFVYNVAGDGNKLFRQALVYRITNEVLSANKCNLSMIQSLVYDIDSLSFYPYELIKTELLKLELANTTTTTMNITAQNYSTETAKLDLSSLSKEQQNFHALVLPHVVRFDKDIANDKNKEAQTKLTAYYNFMSVKLQGTANPQPDKNKIMQMRKRKAIALLLLSNSNK